LKSLWPEKRPTRPHRPRGLFADGFSSCALPAAIYWLHGSHCNFCSCPSIFNFQRSRSLHQQPIRARLQPDAYRYLIQFFQVVGLVRIELTTSPLSGVRSSQLSYRPIQRRVERLFSSERLQIGGAGRDRTGDLLSANQALSQLSYSPLVWALWVGSFALYKQRRPTLSP
jgi:hypothetical protein